MINLWELAGLPVVNLYVAFDNVARFPLGIVIIDKCFNLTKYTVSLARQPLVL